MASTRSKALGEPPRWFVEPRGRECGDCRVERAIGSSRAVPREEGVIGFAAVDQLESLAIGFSSLMCQHHQIGGQLTDHVRAGHVVHVHPALRRRRREARVDLRRMANMSRPSATLQ